MVIGREPRSRNPSDDGSTAESLDWRINPDAPPPAARDDLGMTDTVNTALAALGVAGQVVAAALLLVGVAALFGVRGPAQRVR